MSLMELVVTMGIVAVLMSVGVPSYRYVTNSNRIAGEVNGLIGDMQLARANAIREGRNTIICISTDGATCLGRGVNWAQGWIICSGTTITNTCDNSAGQEVWKLQKAFTSTDTFTADNATSVVLFNREGFAVLPTAVTVTMHATPSATQFTRCVQIDRAGTLSTETAGTGNCT